MTKYSRVPRKEKRDIVKKNLLLLSDNQEDAPQDGNQQSLDLEGFYTRAKCAIWTIIWVTGHSNDSISACVYAN